MSCPSLCPPAPSSHLLLPQTLLQLPGAASFLFPAPFSRLGTHRPRTWLLLVFYLSIHLFLTFFLDGHQRDAGVSGRRWASEPEPHFPALPCSSCPQGSVPPTLGRQKKPHYLEEEKQRRQTAARCLHTQIPAERGAPCIPRWTLPSRTAAR